MSKKRLIKTSKYLSRILRHKPQVIGLELDAHGWACVDDLLKRTDISRNLLEEVVHNDNKQRFSFSPDGTKLRANQGHSLEGIDLGLTPRSPPEYLFHGTVEKFMASIKKTGLKKWQGSMCIYQQQWTLPKLSARDGEIPSF